MHVYAAEQLLRKKPFKIVHSLSLSLTLTHSLTHFFTHWYPSMLNCFEPKALSMTKHEYMFILAHFACKFVFNNN